MRRKKVESEALRSVGYDTDQHLLEIEFHSGEVYRYFDVPPSIHDELMKAESHGEYFSHHVRDVFAYEHLD